MRVCPLCNSTTDASHCARDGTATIRVVTQAPPGLPRTGDVIAGRYRIEGPLGAGGFGAVYRVTHTGTGQACALKVLVLSGEHHQQSMRRFYAEARVTAGLQHVNTVRVFDFGQDDRGWYFLAMELLVGRTLAEWLAERRARLQVMSQGEAVHVAVSVLRSLTEAHGAGLVHRDLKPHNIFLQSIAGDEPTVKVLDFGIAKSAEFALTVNDQALGTPLYMSPEQCLSEPIDGRADLYSLGCLLFQMVTGSPPFKGNSVAAIVLQQVSTPAPDVAALARTEISPDFAAVIERALRKTAAERYSSAQEMREALRHCARPHSWELGPLPEPTAEGGSGAAENLEHGTTSDAGILGRPTAQPAVRGQLATVVQPHRAMSAERATPQLADELAAGEPLPNSYTVAVLAPGAAGATSLAAVAEATAGYSELATAAADAARSAATPPAAAPTAVTPAAAAPTAAAPTVATATALPAPTKEQLATTADLSAIATAGLPAAALPRPEALSAGGQDPGVEPGALRIASAIAAGPPRPRGAVAVAVAATAIALALGLGWAVQRQAQGESVAAPAGVAEPAAAETVARPAPAAGGTEAPPAAGAEDGAANRALVAAAAPTATAAPAQAAVAAPPAAVPEPAPAAEPKAQAATGRPAARARKATDKGAEPGPAQPAPAAVAAPAAPAQPAPAKEDRL